MSNAMERRNNRIQTVHRRGAFTNTAKRTNYTHATHDSNKNTRIQVYRSSDQYRRFLATLYDRNNEEDCYAPPIAYGYMAPKQAGPHCGNPASIIITSIEPMRSGMGKEVGVQLHSSNRPPSHNEIMEKKTSESFLNDQGNLMNLDMPNFKSWLMSRIVYPDVSYNGTDFVPARDSKKSASTTVRVITHIGNILRTLNYIYLRKLGVEDERTDPAINSQLQAYFLRRNDQSVDLQDNEAVAFYLSKILVKYIRNFRTVLLGIEPFVGKPNQSMDVTMTEIYDEFVRKLRQLEASSYETSEYMKHRDNMHPAAYYYCFCRLMIQNYELVTKDILFQGASEIVIGWFIQKLFLGNNAIAWEALEEVYTRLALESTLKKIAIKKIPHDILDEDSLRRFLFKNAGKGVENTFKFWDFMRRNIMDNLFNVDEVPGEKQAHRIVQSVDIVNSRKGLFPTLLVLCPSLIQNSNIEDNLMELFLERVLSKGAGRDFIVKGEVTVGKVNTTKVKEFLKERLENIKKVKEIEEKMDAAMENADDNEEFINQQAMEHFRNLANGHTFNKKRWNEFIRQTIMLARGGTEVHWKIANKLFDLMMQYIDVYKMNVRTFHHILVNYAPEGSWIRNTHYIHGHVYDMRKYVQDIARQVVGASEIRKEDLEGKIEEIDSFFGDQGEMEYIPYVEAVANFMDEEKKNDDEDAFVCPICQEFDEKPIALHTTDNGIDHCICTKCSGNYRKYFSMCCICRVDLD